MTTKKKATKPKTPAKRKPRKRKAAIKPKEDAGPRANYGANEHPRYCVKCRSTNTRIKDTKPHETADRTVRYRICKACGQNFTTVEFHKVPTA